MYNIKIIDEERNGLRTVERVAAIYKGIFRESLGRQNQTFNKTVSVLVFGNACFYCLTLCSSELLDVRKE